MLTGCVFILEKTIVFMNRLNFRSHSNNSITRSNKSIFKTNKISIVISFLLLLILTIESCKKSKEDVLVISDPIASARIALADATREKHTDIDTSMYRQSLRRTVLWEKAILRKIGDSTIVYAPIRLSKELTIKEGGQPGVSVNNISWLVVTKFKEKYKFDMVLRIPNKEAGTTGKFNGVLIVDDWFGKRQTFYIDKDKEKSNTSNRKDANGDIITTMGSSCRTTSYTICAGNDNYCYTTYETTCTYTSEPPINDDPYDPYGGDNPGGQVPGNGGGGGDSTPPNIRISLDVRLKYPVLAKVIDGLYDKVKVDAKLMEAIKQFSHLTEQQILDNLKPGTGPQLQVSDQIASIGFYDPSTSSILINQELAEDTNYLTADYPKALEFYMSVVILHEFIHFGENYTQIFAPYTGHATDVGYQFEDNYYGGRVIFNYLTGALTFDKL